VDEFLANDRRYWRIEGAFHQRLDGALLEDDSRGCQRNAAFLLGLFRRLAVSLAAHWIAEQPGARQSSILDFCEAMDAHGTPQVLHWQPPAALGFTVLRESAMQVKNRS